MVTTTWSSGSFQIDEEYEELYALWKAHGELQLLGEYEAAAIVLGYINGQKYPATPFDSINAGLATWSGEDRVIVTLCCITLSIAALLIVFYAIPMLACFATGLC